MLKKYLRMGLTAVVAITVVFFDLTAMAAQTVDRSATSSFTPSQTREIQQIVHDYLVNQPEVLAEAARSYQEKQSQQNEQFALDVAMKNKQKIFHDPSTPVIGNKDGDIIIVEFFDYQCGHCKGMSSIVENLINENKDLKVILKDWPIFGQNSTYAAKAALAVAKLNPENYLAFHRGLFAAEDALTQDKVKEIAEGVGIDFKAISQNIDTPYTQQELSTNSELAEAMKLAGTPAFIITNKLFTKSRLVPGSTSQEDLQTLIKEIRSEKN